MRLPSDIRSLCLAAAAAFIFLTVAGVGAARDLMPYDGQAWLRSDPPGAFLDLSELNALQVPARAARCTTLFFANSPFESRLSWLVRMQRIHEVQSLFGKVPALPPMTPEVQELRKRRIAEELELLPGYGMLVLMFNYLTHVVLPLEQFIIMDESRAAVWELNLPCFATDYDRTVNQLRMQYAAWSFEITARMAQSLEGLDEVDCLAAMDQAFWKRLRPLSGMHCD